MLLLIRFHQSNLAHPIDPLQKCSASRMPREYHKANINNLELVLHGDNNTVAFKTPGVLKKPPLLIFQ